jgi:mannose/fructose/N-acetylgalactosamine-specific phosphotransferase system component IID
MTGLGRALLRLYAVQGAWSYERMLGVGMGYAAQPLLRDLETADPRRHAEAAVRSAEFFNSHPNLAGLALGSTVRAEYLGVPADRVARLRTALCGPLGALGDQFFWAGLVPLLSAFAIAGVALGAGWWPVAAFVVGYNLVRLATARWALVTGIRAGTDVGRAIGASWLPRWAALVGPPAGFAVGLAVPLVARWYLSHYALRGVLATLFVTAVGLALGRWWGRAFTTVRFALTAAAVTLLLRWVIA